MRNFIFWFKCDWSSLRRIHMMRSSNGIIFSVTGHLCTKVTGEFPAQRPVTRGFDIFFDLHPYNRLRKHSWGSLCETPSGPLRRHCIVWKWVRRLPETNMTQLTDVYMSRQVECIMKLWSIVWLFTSLLKSKWVWFVPKIQTKTPVKIQHDIL